MTLRILIIAALVVVAAPAGAQSGRNRILRDEIAQSHATSVYDLVRSRRPAWLNRQHATSLSGESAELAVFVCRTAEGLQFHVRPRGTTEEWATMYRERASYVGRPLTVSYQNLTDEGIPRFPVGIGCRESWDGAAPAS